MPSIETSEYRNDYIEEDQAAMMKKMLFKKTY